MMLAYWRASSGYRRKYGPWKELETTASIQHGITGRAKIGGASARLPVRPSTLLLIKRECSSRRYGWSVWPYTP